MVKVLIIDAFMQGYVAGKEYMVEPAEAKRLVDGGFGEITSTAPAPKKENAVALGHAKAEKAVKA
jgi:hypothetical protein